MRTVCLCWLDKDEACPVRVAKEVCWATIESRTGRRLICKNKKNQEITYQGV